MQLSRRIRLLIVDDHKVVRVGLKQLLEEIPDIEVDGEAANADQAMVELKSKEFDVVLLDLRLPDGQGFDLCECMESERPGIAALILTSYLDEDVVMKCMAAGADGYLLKEIDGPDLAAAIRSVAAGQAAIDPRATRHIIDKLKPTLNPLVRLSVQERKVLALVGEGKTNKEIGTELGLGEKTVRNYLTAVMQKLNVSRRAEAAVLYDRFSR
jgi:DNA-binding NarL/FixJ family response regulator